MTVEPLACARLILLEAPLRGRLTLRFRTIQVCPKDLASVLRQAERAVNRPMAARSGWRTPMSDMRRREFTPQNWSRSQLSTSCQAVLKQLAAAVLRIGT